MTLTSVLGIVAVAFVVLMLGMQVLVRARARALMGKPLPALPGELGRKVADSKRAMLYFFSPGCAACRPLTPRVKALAEKNASVFAVDVSRDLELALALKVMATPSTVEIVDGTIVGVHVGTLPEDLVARFA